MITFLKRLIILIPTLTLLLITGTALVFKGLDNLPKWIEVAGDKMFTWAKVH